MKLISLVASLALLAAGYASARDVYVKPHTRSDGTYVQGHYRTAPDSSVSNNYSTRGNQNPYTGRQGTVDPYRSQSGNSGSYDNQGSYKSKDCYSSINC